jgi:di/tricarboxylate transporter
MTQDQLLILIILLATIVMFLWGRWRHDVVALASLLACVFAGLVPADDAFTGFAHPAVITVACVLVLSRGLLRTGAVDALAQYTVPSSAGPTWTIAALTGVGAVLSSFMNNVGAMALLLPLAIQIAEKQELPPGKVLMPLAFGTILGGMTTLIGTPPNLIVSGFRAANGGDSFGMFDFTPVGLVVASVGILFVTLIGWRIVPARKQQGVAGFDTGTYLTETRVTEDSVTVGKTLQQAQQIIEEAGAQIIGMVRNEFRIYAPNPLRTLRTGDVLIIEVEPESITSALSSLGLNIEGAVSPDSAAEEEQVGSKKRIPPEINGEESAEDETKNKKQREEQEVVLQELVVMATSSLIGRSACNVEMCTRYGINLLAISRQGRRSINRVRSMLVRAGDVLLMQGAPDALSGFAAAAGCVPLAKRAIHMPDKRRTTLAMVVMIMAIAGAAFGLLPAAISFAAGVLMFVVLRLLPVREIYEAIDWPVIVLLGALITVASAMASTGTADLLAQMLLDNIAQGHPIIALTIILVVTMTLSDFMNNAATAAVMCPIAISTAAQLGVNADPYLMAIAIGAACAFLTPIGHQNNTLILGPGGFHFGDYWRMGLPLEILVVVISIPMLLLVWPL